jgi:exonuclease SbcC
LTAVLGQNLVSEGSDSNGSGKSSLLELLPIALFGPPMPWSEYLTAGGDVETCEVGCELEHAGERYRLRRTYSAKGRGSTKLDFERLDLENVHDVPEAPSLAWFALTRDSQQATQEAIVQTLSLSEAVFAHSVYAAQGARHFADPTLPPRERKAILAEALELDSWERLLLLVRADISETKSELDAIEVRLGTFAEEIGRLPEMREAHAELVENAADAERVLAEHEQLAVDTAEQYAARMAAIAEYERAALALSVATTVEMQLRAEIDAGRQAAEEGKTLAETLPALLAEAGLVDELAAAVAAMEHSAETRAQAIREKDRLTKGQTTLREQAKQLMDEESEHTRRATTIRAEMKRLAAEGSGVCEHCKQPIRGTALEESVDSMGRDAAALDARAAELRTAIEATIAEGTEVSKDLAEMVIPEAATNDMTPGIALAKARQAERDLATTEERIRQLGLQVDKVTTETITKHEQAVEALAAAEVARKAAEPEASGIDWNATRDHVASQLGMAKSADNQARTALATSEEKIRNLEELAGRSQEAVLAKGLLEGRLEHLKQMETAYGKNGIPALLIEAHGVPQIEREASRILEQLGVPFRIELVTQREKKAGGLADTLDVVVHGPDGPLRFESYSGGEQSRLAFALRIALARLIASRRASQIGVLFLDEISFLDATGLAAVAEVLKGLSEFRSIVLVSHDERLVDSFDSVITVVRDETGSRLEAA